MNSTFKIFIQKSANSVVCKGILNNFKNYKDLSDKVFEDTQKGIFKKKNLSLNKSDKFILKFEEIKDDFNNFIPEEIKSGIFDENSFKFFKEKLIAHGKDEKYKLYIEKVDSFPKFIVKGEEDILNESLKKYWDIALKDITSELNLKKLEESNNEFKKLKKEKEKNEEIMKKNKHNNVICSNCFQKDFNGKRFICSECDNYNLCQECEKILLEKGIHQREHILIQINKNLDEDISKYSIILGNYRKEFQNVEDVFNIEIVLVNNGDNDLQNCYILPIRYGEDYLRCEKVKINESIERNYSEKIKMMIILPNSDKKYYEGYFRMFTPSGLPFGQVIFIKVFIYE